MKRRLAYEKPKLRKVRLDIKTSVLSVCQTSIVTDAGSGCQTIGSGCWVRP